MCDKLMFEESAQNMKVIVLMLSTAAVNNSESPKHLFLSILDKAEMGIIVVDSSARAVYMNDSARNILNAPAGILPDWVPARLASTVNALGAAEQKIERWEHEDLALRVRARPLDPQNGYVVLEMRVAKGAGARHVADQLARGLGITISDGKLLDLLWRGMSNDEIAQKMGVRVGTIKSRLFRLYQRLGVKRRPAAVLRAAEVIAS